MMIKIKFCFLILFVLAFRQQGYAQQVSLIGTYRVHLANTLAVMDNEGKHKYEALDAQAKERARLSIEHRVFVLREGGQIEVRWKVNGSDKTASGTWELKDGDELVIEVEERITKFSYSQPTANALVLKNTNGKGLFNNLFMEKVQ
jgi:hypothetical protein